MSGFERMFLFRLWGWGGAAAPRSLIVFALTSRIASFLSAMLSARCFFSPSSAFLARTCSPRCVRDGASHARRSSRLACNKRAASSACAMKSSFMCNEKSIGGDTFPGVVVRSAPPTPFDVSKAKLLLEVLVVTLNAPAHFGDVHEIFGILAAADAVSTRSSFRRRTQPS